MKHNQIKHIIEQADHERVHVYMDIFDRVLLYTLASNLMSKEAIDASIDIWDLVIKRGIDEDATKRTNYLEGTTLGRAAKIKKESDGEDLRLHCLKQWKIARQVILANLQQQKDTEDFNDGLDPV